MINNVLSNLFSRPATRNFPAVSRDPVKDVRGTVTFDMEKCIYCGACALKCPAEAITVNRAEKTVEFDLFKCVACACCAEACKKGCVQMVSRYHGPVAVKPDIRMQGTPIVDSSDE